MTQSKDNESYTITLDSGETIDLSGLIETTGDITIDLNNTYGTTTTYWAGDNITDITISGSNDGTFTLNSDFNYIWEDTRLDPDAVEKMCKHYPGLEKVWRNFKSVYDMCKQDYEGKKKAGEIDDDDIPF